MNKKWLLALVAGSVAMTMTLANANIVAVHSAKAGFKTVAVDDQSVTSDNQGVTSDDQGVTSDDQGVTSDNQDVSSNQVTSDNSDSD